PHPVELAERVADGEASRESLTRYRATGYNAILRCCVISGGGYGGPYDYWHEILKAFDETREHEADSARSALLRDICGNPFRPIDFDPAWRTKYAVGIASKMYLDRDFEAMPILADALEEAGCDNADLLVHCREPGTHVRGCWVVDGVLNK